LKYISKNAGEEMKKFLALMGLLLVVLANSGCGPTNKTAVIEKAVLAAEVNKELVKVEEATDGFDANADRILFAGVVKNGGSQMEVRWVKNKTKKVLKKDNKPTATNGSFKYEIIKPATGWDDGDYTMEVFSGNKKIAEKEFAIQESTKKANIYSKKNDKSDQNKSVKGAKSDTSSNIQSEKNNNANKKELLTPKSNPASIQSTQKPITTPDKATSTTFINGSMCDGVNSDGGCINKVDYYYDNAKSFFANTEWKNLKANDELWGVWYWEGFNGKGEYISDSSVKVTGNQNGFINFSLNNTQKNWYNGSYWIEVYYNGAYFTTIPFGVYTTDFKPTYKYPSTGYYDEMGNFILYNGTGYYDKYGTFWNFGTDWGLDGNNDGYPEAGYYDEFGNYILDDGTGYYDLFGNFWFWEEMYGDGWYDEEGNYYLADGTGYYDIYGNYWPLEEYVPTDNSDGYYDEEGNYILNDGTGYFDMYGNFWSWNDDYFVEDGYYDSAGNYVLYDGSGFYDPSGAWQSYDNYDQNDEYQESDGYFDAYGNYILNDGSGYFDTEGVFRGWEEYTYDDYVVEDYTWDHPNGDVEYWDEGEYYFDDYYYDESGYDYSDGAVG
jgi:hypothetical protein